MAKLKNRLWTLVRELEDKEHHRISNSELARDAQVSRDTIVRMMNGDDIGISSQTIKNLCAYFRCQPGDLLYIEYEPGEIAS